MSKTTALLLSFFAVIFLFTACRRSDVFGGIETNTDRVIAEFTDARTGTSISRDFSAEPIEVELTELRLDPRTVTDHATKVRVTVNPVAVNDYNAENGTSYVSAPAAAFSLAPDTYTLTAQQRSVKVRAVLRPSAFLDNKYAVGLSIAEMSDGEISSIAKRVVVFVSIKNEYDGIYRVKGYSDIPATPYTGNFNLACADGFEVATSSATSVYLSPAQPVYNTGGYAYITNLLPEFTIDKATNKIVAVTGRTGSLACIFPYDAAYNSRYDPATKTIYIKYGVAPAGSGRYVIDTLTYCGPR